MPDKEPTIATSVSLQAHVPPVVASVSRDSRPAQPLVAPVIGVGEALTLMVAEVEHPFTT